MKFIFWLKKNRRKIQVDPDRLSSMPMVPVLFYWIAGCMVVGLPLCQSPRTLVVFFPLLLFGSFMLPVKNKKSTALFLSGAVMTATIWFWNSSPEAFPEGKYVEVEAEVSDLISVSQDFCYNDKVGLEVVIKKFRFPKGDWNSCGEKVMMRLSKGRSYTYGQKVIAGGYFFCPSESSYKGGFDYRNYLRMKGISWTFTTKWSTGRDPQDTWRGKLSWVSKCREAILGRLAYAIEAPPVIDHNVVNVDKSDKVRTLLAMAVGLKGNLTKSEKDAFVKSGMFHLFAVSGLHVGIIAMIMLFLLRLLPYRWRYFLLPFLLFFYTLMVGWPPSAVRAWLMISIWAFGRAFYLPTNHYNTIASAAFILLVIDPFLLFQAGFQFSFLVVLFLIASFSWHQRIVQTLKERSLWIPDHHRTNGKGHKILFWGLSSTVLGLTVTLAVSGLQAFYYGLFIPISILFAAVTGVLALIILSLAMVKVATAGLGYYIVGSLNAVLELMLTIIYQLAHWLGTNGLYGSFAKPGLLSVVVYYMAAWWLVVTSGYRVRAACLVLVVGIVFSWHLQPASEYKIICLRKGATKAPAMIISSIDKNEVVLVNPGIGNQGYLLNYYFKDRGINTITLLVITEPKLGKDAALAVSGRLVRHLLLPVGWEKYSWLVEIRNSLALNGTNISVFCEEETSLVATCGAIEVSLEKNDQKSAILVNNSGHLYPESVRLQVDDSGEGKVLCCWPTCDPVETQLNSGALALE